MVSPCGSVEERGARGLAGLRRARRELERCLGALGQYVNAEANGNPLAAQQSGFRLSETKRVPHRAPPPAPQDVSLFHGKLSGTMLVRLIQSVRFRQVSEAQVCVGDPGDEAQWRQAGFITGDRGEIKNRPPGAVIWVRVRTVGLRGVLGAWSDLAEIRVL